MEELPGKIRVQDAVLANMVTLSAILEYLESIHPGAKLVIDQRAIEIARAMKANLESPQGEDGRE